MNVMSKKLCDTCQCLFYYKHRIFVRSLPKCITINSPKSILVRLYSTERDIKYKKNYYDILKIAPYATQSEIKSAYYNLSLQYHPDKNKSDYAKQKFQDISDAYEILSNHEQRKNYDRQMMIHQQLPVTNVKGSSQYRSKVYTGATKIYNFDAWTQAHYTRQFEIDHMRRNNYKQQKKIDEISMHEEKMNSPFEYILIFLTTMFIIGMFYQNHDIPVHEKEKHIEKNKVHTN